jgi:hypothetical protein
MPKKKKPTRTKAALAVTQNGPVLPQSMAHTFQRELVLPPANLAKMNELLAQGLPIKISLDVKSKLFTPVVGGGMGDDEIIIDDQDLQPPDPGEDIPEEEQNPEAIRSGAATAQYLTGVTIQVFSVAVFRPQYSSTKP